MYYKEGSDSAYILYIILSLIHHLVKKIVNFSLQIHYRAVTIL